MSKCRANTLYAVMVGNSSILLSVPIPPRRVRFTYALFFTGLGKKGFPGIRTPVTKQRSN